MTTTTMHRREYTLRCGYRPTRFGWKGLVYWNPDWVAMNLDGIPSQKAWSGWARTERGIRRKMAKALSRERFKHDEDQWRYRGKRRAAA